MPHTVDATETLRLEHSALVAAYGRAQARCSALLAAQDAELQRLQAAVLRLRAEVMLRDTLLDALRDPPAAMDAAVVVAADLVICQTGCVGHDAYWRVQDHCRRTGKTCVLVEQPQALRIVRGGQPSEDLLSNL